MIQQRLSQHGHCCGGCSVDAGVAGSLADDQQLLRIGRMSLKVSELFIVKPRQDVDFMSIRLATQTSHARLLDHLRQVARGFPMQSFSQHSRGFDVLDAVEKDQCLQR